MWGVPDLSEKRRLHQGLPAHGTSQPTPSGAGNEALVLTRGTFVPMVDRPGLNTKAMKALLKPLGLCLKVDWSSSLRQRGTRGARHRMRSCQIKPHRNLQWLHRWAQDRHITRDAIAVGDRFQRSETNCSDRLQFERTNGPLRSEDAVTKLLLDVVRGDEEWPKLVTIGITIRMDPSRCEIDELPGIADAVPKSSEVATGFVRNWALGSELHDWARVVLRVNAIDLRELEEDNRGQVLLDALWTAAEEGSISDEVIESIRQLAASS